MKFDLEQSFNFLIYFIYVLLKLQDPTLLYFSQVFILIDDTWPNEIKWLIFNLFQTKSLIMIKIINILYQLKINCLFLSFLNIPSKTDYSCKFSFVFSKIYQFYFLRFKIIDPFLLDTPLKKIFIRGLFYQISLISYILKL